MRPGSLGALSTALFLGAACGGGSPEAPDASLPDATPPMIDAGPTGSCFDDLVDLDDPTIGQHTGNQVLYMGVVRAGGGDLAPQSGCTAGMTGNEKAHKITSTDRVRFRAHTIGMGTPNLDSVVYIRTSCTDQSSEVACNDAVGTQEMVVGTDVPAGTTVFIIVDSAQNQPVPLPQPYALTVIMDPVVNLGDPCDVTGQTNACETGTVCSVATGSPVCATPLGGPNLTALSARERENTVSFEISIVGDDPDGDIQQAMLSIINDSGAVIDLNGDGIAGDEFAFGTDPALPGNLTVNAQIEFLGPINPAFLDTLASVRMRLVDSAGTSTPMVTAPIAHGTLVGEGGTCGPLDLECQGELMCTATICTEPTSAVDACAAADASAGITASGTYQVNLAIGAPDNFAGSCFYDTNYGEQILKVTVPGPSQMRVTADSSVAPSGADIDTYLYLRSSCTDPSTEMACNDDIGGGPAPLASLVSAALTPGTYYLVVDGSSEYPGYTPWGDVGVSVTMTPLLDPGAPCIPGTDECVPDYYCADPTGGTTTSCITFAEVVAAECATAPIITSGVAVTGSVTLSSPSLVDGSCRYSGPWPEQYHVLDLTERSTVTATTAGAGTNFDTVVFFLDGCSSTAAEIAGACNDDIDPSSPDWRSTVTTTLDPGTYAIVVDMSSPSLPDGSGSSPDPAAYSLLVTVTPAP
jgi:hypothetical protein